MSKGSARPPQTPLCLALVLADAVHQDPSSRKHTILGTFSTLYAPAFPAVHPFMAAYTVLTDGMGPTPVKLQIVDGDTDTSLVEAEAEVNFDTPWLVLEIVLILEKMVFPRAGRYRLQLWSAEHLLMERRLMVVHAPQQV